MDWLKWKVWNDQIGLIFVILIFGLWICEPIISQYYGKGLPESVLGATVVIITLIAQYYFRRKEPGENGKNGGGNP